MSERGNVACCVAKMQEFETVRGQRRLAICLRAIFFRNLAFLLENRKIVSKFREVFRKKKKIIIEFQVRMKFEEDISISL